MNVLLVYPSSTPHNPNIDIHDELNVIPMNLMAIAALLEQEGHDVQILDERAYLKKEFQKKFEATFPTVDCVGFSVMTAHIKEAYRLSNQIKQSDKSIPVVWGGIHPTLFPEQTVRDECVDFIVRGEGEYSFLKLLDYLDNPDLSIEDIEGLAYLEKDTVKLNTPVVPIDIKALPRIAYHLIDMEKYIPRVLLNGKRVRGMDILTSRGCPYRCAFCVNPFWSYRKWRASSAERVLEDIDFLVNTYQINHLWFADDFFFGDLKRVRTILEGIKKYNLTWEANIRVDSFSENRVNDTFLQLIKESGCYMLSMGMESGSDKVLKHIQKNTTVEQILNAVKQCQKVNIYPRGYWLTGMPGETIEDTKKTVSLIWKIHKTQPRDRHYTPSLYNPYPGGQLYEDCKRLGLKEPQTLKEWVDNSSFQGYLDPGERLWISEEKLLSDLITYGKLVQIADIFLLGKIKLLKPLGALLRWWIEFRDRKNFWGIRFEPFAYNLMNKLLGRLYRSFDGSNDSFKKTYRKLLFGYMSYE